MRWGCIAADVNDVRKWREFVGAEGHVEDEKLDGYGSRCRTELFGLKDEKSAGRSGVGQNVPLLYREWHDGTT